MAEIRIIQSPDKEHPFAVVYKPASLPSAPLKAGEESALTQALACFPELKDVHGKKEIEHGLVHRIDTATKGLLLIAATQSAYENFKIQQKDHEFIKFYKARVEPEKAAEDREFSITSMFRPFGPKGKLVKPVFLNSSAADKKKAGKKVYTTNIRLEGNFAICSIAEGYRHQVRAHLAYCGYPIKGDLQYNPSARENETMEFEAYRIEFINPATGKKITYEA